MKIVGVVRDVIHRRPRDQARPVLYTPVAQATIFLSPATLVVRSSGAPMRLVDSVRQTISQTDPNSRCSTSRHSSNKSAKRSGRNDSSRVLRPALA